MSHKDDNKRNLLYRDKKARQDFVPTANVFLLVTFIILLLSLI